MDKKMCGHCKRGEIYDVPADFQVKGKNGDGRFIPKMFICQDHLTMEEEDGSEFQVVMRLDLDTLTRWFTAYRSFEELCRNNPTLRPSNQEMQYLRAAFEEVTGHPAAA